MATISKTIKLTINEELRNEFIQTAIIIEGYKRGRRRISAEKAMRLYINYAKPYKNKKLYEVAKENNMEVWEVGELLIDRFMMVYTELGLNINFLTNDEHFKMVVDYLNKYKND